MEAPIWVQEHLHISILMTMRALAGNAKLIFLTQYPGIYNAPILEIDKKGVFFDAIPFHGKIYLNFATNFYTTLEIDKRDGFFFNFVSFHGKSYLLIFGTDCQNLSRSDVRN